jgi:hypothetical protein
VVTSASIGFDAVDLRGDLAAASSRATSNGRPSARHENT